MVQDHQYERPERIDVLGVPVDAVNMQSALAQIRNMFSGENTNIILAVNPEKVISAQKKPELLASLEKAELLVPDGIGVVMAARLLYRAQIERVPGSELMPEICRLAGEDGHSVFLYGARPEIVERVAKILPSRFPGLRVAGTQHGYLPDEQMEGLVDDINRSRAAVLFVALGSPRQELWMERYRDNLEVRVCQGVGGTFDAICGNVQRAPKLFRKLHLEWFYRLISQPHRAYRQKALPVFIGQLIRRLTGIN